MCACGRKEKEKTARGQIWQQQQTRGAAEGVCARHYQMPNAKVNWAFGQMRVRSKTAECNTAGGRAGARLC